MATDTIGGKSTNAIDRPYAPSWIDRLIAWIHALPWPAPVTYTMAGRISECGSR